MKVNVYYQDYRERMEIDMIGRQKWTMILGILWLACHDPEMLWQPLD